MAKKKPTYNFFVQDRDGNAININTLSEEERKEVGVWAYQTLLKGLGYEPVKKEKSASDSGVSGTDGAKRRLRYLE